MRGVPACWRAKQTRSGVAVKEDKPGPSMEEGAPSDIRHEGPMTQTHLRRVTAWKQETVREVSNSSSNLPGGKTTCVKCSSTLLCL